MAFNCLEATELLGSDSLLFTTQKQGRDAIDLLQNALRSSERGSIHERICEKHKKINNYDQEIETLEEGKKIVDQ